MSARDKSVEMAKGLRELAGFIEANPGLAHLFEYCSTVVNVFARGEDPAVELAEAARAGSRAGAVVGKDGSDTFFWVSLGFSGGVALNVNSGRDEVCERVVVGTETVTKRVPDPEKLAAVPTVEVAETVERVEWRCRPLLAVEKAAGVSA